MPGRQQVAQIVVGFGKIRLLIERVAKGFFSAGRVARPQQSQAQQIRRSGLLRRGFFENPAGVFEASQLQIGVTEVGQGQRIFRQFFALFHGSCQIPGQQQGRGQFPSGRTDIVVVPDGLFERANRRRLVPCLRFIHAGLIVERFRLAGLARVGNARSEFRRDEDSGLPALDVVVGQDDVRHVVRAPAPHVAFETIFRCFVRRRVAGFAHGYKVLRGLFPMRIVTGGARHAALQKAGGFAEPIGLMRHFEAIAEVRVEVQCVVRQIFAGAERKRRAFRPAHHRGQGRAGGFQVALLAHIHLPLTAQFGGIHQSLVIAGRAVAALAIDAFRQRIVLAWIGVVTEQAVFGNQAAEVVMIGLVIAGAHFEGSAFFAVPAYRKFMQRAVGIAMQESLCVIPGTDDVVDAPLQTVHRFAIETGLMTAHATAIHFVIAAGSLVKEPALHRRRARERSAHAGLAVGIHNLAMTGGAAGGVHVLSGALLVLSRASRQRNQQTDTQRLQGFGDSFASCFGFGGPKFAARYAMIWSISASVAVAPRDTMSSTTVPQRSFVMRTRTTFSRPWQPVQAFSNTALPGPSGSVT